MGKGIRQSLGIASLVVLAACSAADEEPTVHTDRERDSIIAESRLPGAAGVGAALRVQDRASATNLVLDSIARAQP